MLVTAIEQWRQELIQQGIKQGIEQRIQQGIERGIAQGIEMGIEMGIELVRYEVARRMHQQGFALEDIADVTQLPLAVVEILEPHNGRYDRH